MNIKQILKDNNYTLKDFATEIKLSRPTLDSYIIIYESGEIIPKDRYQIIFDGLFSSELVHDEFLERLNKYKNLLERDQNLGTSSLYVGDADLVSKIHKLMLDDIKRDDCDKNVYFFISLLISSYRDIDVFKQLSDYFAILNNLTEIDESDISKRYLAYFYKVFKSVKDKAPDYTETEFEDFVKRRDEIRVEKIKRRDEKVLAIEQMVKDIADECAQKGLELTKEQLLKELASR